LPAKFHSQDSLNKAINISKTALGDSSVFETGKIDSPLLLLGLIYREVSRSMEVEPGATTDLPDQLANSPFGIRELNKVEKVINDIRLPSIE
jgi:hypothetical protein